MMRTIAFVAVVANSGVALAGDVAVCPGEGARYGDHKCNHDPTHRVCAQLLDASGQPLSWGPQGDFWEITGQKAFQWDSDIRANNGDSWCICMWATAHLITAAGCENVHIRCDSTDVSYVLSKYQDGGVDLEPAKQCLQQKCPGLIQTVDAELPQITGTVAAKSAPLGAYTWFAMLAMGVVAALLFVARSFRSASTLQTGLVDAEDVE